METEIMITVSVLDENDFWREATTVALFRSLFDALAEKRAYPVGRTPMKWFDEERIIKDHSGKVVYRGPVALLSATVILAGETAQEYK